MVTAGRWRHEATADRFADYAAMVMRRLGDRMTWVCTINEANTPLQLKYNGLLEATVADSELPPFVATVAVTFGLPDSDLGLFLTAVDDTSFAVLAEAHPRAVDAVHAERSDAKAGITLSIQQAVAEPGSEQHAEAFDEQINRRFLAEMSTVGDFVGVQN